MVHEGKVDLLFRKGNRLSGNCQIFRRLLPIVVVYECVLFRKSRDFAEMDKIEFRTVIKHV